MVFHHYNASPFNDWEENLIMSYFEHSLMSKTVSSSSIHLIAFVAPFSQVKSIGLHKINYLYVHPFGFPLTSYSDIRQIYWYGFHQ
ncbi:hypothetical protein HanIR_Chr02g0059091 [Helianthus annuus]|nr:hypothetical protein HanIR_Chr02g0059091 [Helianthus annuus]